MSLLTASTADTNGSWLIATEPEPTLVRPRRHEIAVVGLIAGTALTSAAILFLTGSPWLAALPVLVTVAVYAFWTRPLRQTALVYLGLVLIISIPGRQIPGSTTEYWYSPLYPIWRLLFDNLNSVTGIASLRFSGAELLNVLMLLLILVRTLRGVRTDSAGRQPAAKVLYVFLVISFLTVIGMEAWGLMRGGDFKQSLWQFRHLFWLPVMTAVFAYCLRGPRDLLAVAVVATVAACLKIAIGLYYLSTVAWPAQFVPESVTGHDDSVLFASVVFFWCAVWAHRPTSRVFARMLLPCAWVVMGMVWNNRRTVYISLLASLFMLYLVLSGPLKRRLTRGLLLSTPLLVAYLLAGRNHHNGIFKPAAAVMSVSKEQDASTKTRAVENYNLIQTLRPNLLLGTGWGHEYREISKAYDISQYFAQYRYIAHNSILWLLSIGGVLGFGFVWIPVVVAMFLGARSYRFARTPSDKTAAATILAVLICYSLQAWGDMGTQSFSISMLVAWAMAASGKLAHSTRAWPAEVRLTKRRR